MNQFRAVLFDMDGVLINTEPLHFRMWREVFHNRGVEIDYDGYKDCIGATEEFLRELIWKNYAEGRGDGHKEAADRGGGISENARCGGDAEKSV